MDVGGQMRGYADTALMRARNYRAGIDTGYTGRRPGIEHSVLGRSKIGRADKARYYKRLGEMMPFGGPPRAF